MFWAAAVRWFSERNQSDVYNKFTVIYAYKNCTAINFCVCECAWCVCVCEGRSSGYTCSDSAQKRKYNVKNTSGYTNRKIPALSKYLRVHNERYKLLAEFVLHKLQKKSLFIRYLPFKSWLQFSPFTGYQMCIVFISNAVMFHIDDLTLWEKLCHVKQIATAAAAALPPISVLQHPAPCLYTYILLV